METMGGKESRAAASKEQQRHNNRRNNGKRQGESHPRTSMEYKLPAARCGCQARSVPWRSRLGLSSVPVQALSSHRQHSRRPPKCDQLYQTPTFNPRTNHDGTTARRHTSQQRQDIQGKSKRRRKCGPAAQLIESRRKRLLRAEGECCVRVPASCGRVGGGPGVFGFAGGASSRVSSSIASVRRAKACSRPQLTPCPSLHSRQGSVAEAEAAAAAAAAAANRSPTQ